MCRNSLQDPLDAFVITNGLRQIVRTPIDLGEVLPSVVESSTDQLVFYTVTQPLFETAANIRGQPGDSILHPGGTLDRVELFPRWIECCARPRLPGGEVVCL